MGAIHEMIIGIIGLGLIGGSFAKAVKAKTMHTVLGYDVDPQAMTLAKLCGAIDAPLIVSIGIQAPGEEVNIGQCDLLLVAIPPRSAIYWLTVHARDISPNTIVIDLCGVKRAVCDAVIPLAHKHGFTYIGGHPMAGKERSGFVNASESLYDGASMILTPELEHGVGIDILERLKAFFVDVGFSSVTFTSPEEHDRIIAYTSQLAHIISSAYVKSPEALKRRGFSAGSFRDMTRVARLDEKLWTELFMYNADFLTVQLELIIKNINEYLAAIKDNDAERLETLLRKGREAKLQAGGN